MRCMVGPVAAILVTLSATHLWAAGGIQLPLLFNPPPPRAQLADAQIMDPYPLPDVAPYGDGSRPRGFLYPPPEATRGRWPTPGTFPRSEPWLRSSEPAYSPTRRLPRFRTLAPEVPIDSPAAAEGAAATDAAAATVAPAATQAPASPRRTSARRTPTVKAAPAK